MKKMNPVVHFEMPYEDAKRMADFYSGVFGWTTKQWGEEMGNYITAHTTETDEKNMVKTPGNINGGFYPKEAGSPAQYPSVVIAVDDIQESINAVNASGGKVEGEPMDIPGVGLYVAFMDTEGNRVTMLQPKEGM